VRSGPCELADGMGSIASDDLPKYDETAIVTTSQMKRFEQESFKFIGKRNIEGYRAPDLSKYDNVLYDATQKSKFSQSTMKKFSDEILESVRMTSDGFEYSATIDLSNMHLSSSSAAAAEVIDTKPNPQPENIFGDHNHNNVRTRKGRSLTVVGKDTRSLITDTTQWPYRTVAQVDFSPLWEGGCTATLISRDAAITAGHCVYDPELSEWYTVVKIAPGRYSNGTDTIEPFGTWNVDYTTALTGWTQKREQNHDIAVIKLLPNTNQAGELIYPGDVVGYVGMRSPSWLDRRLRKATIIGYPGDKPLGEMWTSGRCPGAWVPAVVQANFRFHFCDTFAGNSGSSILTADGKTLGVHAYGFLNPKNGAGLMNGAILMDNRLFRVVQGWSGLTGSNSGGATCPCDDIKNTLLYNACKVLFVRACNLETDSSN